MRLVWGLSLEVIVNADSKALAKAWGREIRERRKMLGIGQIELAAHCGVSQATISRWESGAMAPRTAMQSRLVSRLAIDPVALHRIVTSSEQTHMHSTAKAAA